MSKKSREALEPRRRGAYGAPVRPPPPLLYGTAWKEDDTARLVRRALDAGFRGIDTANQRKHYHETQVGQALAAAFQGGLTRDQLFLQTKFTFLDGQDHRLPYDAGAKVGTQVAQSFASSLEHLGVGDLDCYLLHGPSRRSGWHAADAEAWAAMEALLDSGRVGALGVSNVSRTQLEALCATARVPPAFVQNRCYAQVGWDAEVRAFCRERKLRYQGFSLLTANPQVLGSAKVRAIAAAHGTSPEQVVFRFALEVGMLPLTGTTDEQHMREDLAVTGWQLTPAELAELDRPWT
jgi:diketogulonate reductase-like aldo/keto reductase